MSKGKFAIGALLGAAAGFIVGIVTAPKSGAETRADIKKEAKDIKENISKKAEEVSKEACEVAGDVKEKTGEVMEDVKEKAEDLKERVEFAAKGAKKGFEEKK